jgi:hypothetical protein
MLLESELRLLSLRLEKILFDLEEQTVANTLDNISDTPTLVVLLLLYVVF